MSVDCPLILSLSKDAVLTVTLFDLRVDSGFLELLYLRR
jgi:hypothetical protein